MIRRPCPRPAATGVSLVLLSLLLAACGGGGATPEPPPPEPPPDPPDTETGLVVAGVAATGAALDGATIRVRDAAGAFVEVGDVLTGADGRYRVELPPELALPVLVEVVPPSGPTLRSVVPAPGAPSDPVVANVNPVTEAVAGSLVGPADTAAEAVGAALGAVAAAPDSVAQRGDEILGAVLGQGMTYATFAADPDFVAATGGDGAATPSVADTLLDTLATTAGESEQDVATFLAEQAVAEAPPRLLAQPRFQVRLVGDLVSAGNAAEDLEQRLTDSGALPPAADDGTPDSFRAAVATVPQVVARVSAAAGLETSPSLQRKAAAAAVEALAELVTERGRRFGEDASGVAGTLGAAAIVDTVAGVVERVVVPILAEAGAREDAASLDDALDRVVGDVGRAAGQTLSAFTPAALAAGDVSGLASAHLQRNVVAADVVDRLADIASGMAGSDAVVSRPADVRDVTAALQQIVEEEPELAGDADPGIAFDDPPGAWDVDAWNEFDWT